MIYEIVNTMKTKKLSLGIVGGGPKSWIGHVHRISARFDNQYEIVAGVFSRNAKLSIRFGQSIGIAKDRCYSNFKEMADNESKREDCIEVVSIMTPPASHQIIAEKFIDKDIHIISDKPFAGNLEQAKKLYKKIKSNKKIKYALTHNYSAYPMVREAKVLVEKGKIGKVEYVNVEYIQDWSGGENITSKNAKKKLKWKHPYLGYDIRKKVNVKEVVEHLINHSYCGIANGRAEFGPRALGNRSFIADPRRDIKDTVNQIKRRQKFRPFAPAILEEYANEYFEGPMNRYMQFVAKAKHDHSSVTHVDGTARVQIVEKNKAAFAFPSQSIYIEKK